MSTWLLLPSTVAYPYSCQIAKNIAARGPSVRQSNRTTDYCEKKVIAAVQQHVCRWMAYYKAAS